MVGPGLQALGLDGELGTTQWAPPNSVGATTNVVNQFGRQLLWSQAIAANEQPHPRR